MAAAVGAAVTAVTAVTAVAVAITVAAVGATSITGIVQGAASRQTVATQKNLPPGNIPGDSEFSF